MFASFVPVMMDIAPELAIFASLTGILIGFLISSFGVLVLAVISGYYVKIIKNTLDGEFELPEWDNFKELLKKGAYFLTGMFILQIIRITSYNVCYTKLLRVIFLTPGIFTAAEIPAFIAALTEASSTPSYNFV